MPEIILSDKKPIVSLEDFLSTYKNPGRKYDKDNVRFLEAKGLLPLEYTSLLFPQVNFLVSQAMWGGSVSQGTQHRPRVDLSLNEKTLESLRKGIPDLELELIVRGRDYILGKNGSAYARLISRIPGMFFSCGSADNRDLKSRRKFSFPDYLGFLTTNFERLRGHNKNIARKVISDNLRVLLENRASNKGSSPNHFSVKLPHNVSRDSALGLASQIYEMFDAVYPLIGLTPDSVSCYLINRRNRKQLYSSEINFKVENTKNAVVNYGLFDGVMDRGFQPYGRKVTAKQRDWWTSPIKIELKLQQEMAIAIFLISKFSYKNLRIINIIILLINI